MLRLLCVALALAISSTYGEYLYSSGDLQQLPYHYGEYASSYDNYKPHDYKFEYGVSDPYTGDHKSQWEVKENGVVRGAYSLLEPDGTTRIVEYYADDSGFHADVKKIGHGVHSHTIHPEPEPLPVVYKNIADSIVYNGYGHGGLDHNYGAPIAAVPHSVVKQIEAPIAQIQHIAPVQQVIAPEVHDYQSLVSKYAPLLTQNVKYPEVNYQPEIAYHQPEVKYAQPEVKYQLPEIQYSQPEVKYVQQAPEVKYVQPQVKYLQPEYVQPSVKYVQQDVKYLQPEVVHHQHDVSYVQQPEVKYVQQSEPVYVSKPVEVPQYVAPKIAYESQPSQLFGKDSVDVVVAPKLEVISSHDHASNVYAPSSAYLPVDHDTVKVAPLYTEAKPKLNPLMAQIIKAISTAFHIPILSKTHVESPKVVVDNLVSEKVYSVPAAPKLGYQAPVYSNLAGPKVDYGYSGYPTPVEHKSYVASSPYSYASINQEHSHGVPYAVNKNPHY